MIARRMLSTAALVLIITLLLSALPRTTLAQTDERCFDETTFCISGPIRHYWETNGGLPVFGYPKSVQYEEIIEGKPYQVQWFERNRLEIHPENPPPYNVLLGRLGATELEKAMEKGEWDGSPPEGPLDGCVYFEQTGFNICYQEILDMYRSNGLEVDGQPGFSVQDNIALFGLPLTPVITEQLEGDVYEVQYFERARFEWHPDKQMVLLGLLGNNLLDRGIVNLPHTPYVVAHGAMSIELPVHWPRAYVEFDTGYVIVCMSPDYMSWIVLTIVNTAGLTEDQKIEVIKDDLRQRFKNTSNLSIGDVEEQPDGSFAIPFSYNDNEENGAEVTGKSFYQEDGNYMTIMTPYAYSGHFGDFVGTYQNIINTYQINPNLLP